MRYLFLLLVAVTIAFVGLLVTSVPVDAPEQLFTPATASPPVEVEIP